MALQITNNQKAPKGGKRKGAGRKSSPNPAKVPITIRVDPAIAQWLNQKAKENNTTRSKLTESIIIKEKEK